MARLDVKEAAGFVLAGAIVGATVTLLCVLKNKEVKIKEIAKSGSERLEDLHETIQEQIAGWIEEMMNIVKCGTDRGKILSSQGYDRVFEGFDTAKQCLEDGRSHLEKRITSPDSV